MTAERPSVLETGFVEPGARLRIYRSIADPALRRLIANLNRSEAGPARGAFDRDYWAWGFRDFPPIMLQSAAYPLALAWARRTPGDDLSGNPRLADWIGLSVDWTLGRQHRSGAFDQVFPNDQDVGATLGIAHALCRVYDLVGSAWTSPRRERALEAIDRACRFASGRDESHAFVSNHVALFGLAMHLAGELLDRPAYRDRSRGYMQQVLAHQSEEGWFEEYQGPDPGYETLGINYMAQYWERTGDADVLDALRRSVAFLAHFIHPDASLGGAYGSRHVSLYYPAGFEILATAVPEAASIAAFVASGLEAGRVVTPAVADPMNLPSLCASYLEAASRCAGEAPAGGLPCHELEGARVFPRSGLAVVGTGRLYVVVAGRKGGLARIHDRRSGALVYEDAGYVVTVDGREWTSQVADPERADALAEGHGEPIELLASAAFTAVNKPVPTPFTFLVLRFLNLTVWRSLALGNLLRRALVRRFILGRKPEPLRLERAIRFSATGVHIEDRLVPERPLPVDSVERPRTFVAIHMGSSQYLHPWELDALPRLPPERGEAMRAALRDGRVATFHERVPGTGTEEGGTE